ncbi:hypothetical protein LOTGIDRAFT_113489 [Lottia gigantea]|uniref:Ion transport domain-containing protein n=1 Tax=Lottia gigantea TaxID=225164 RepID=V4AQJ0_LOTGI|nr:hypothetical protein LOTGIDRAFT_113489 [Lottia gigantea]ESO99497.1 hypothetical protein LOTGIDRAFT_113489 [Lottia gigantea]
MYLSALDYVTITFFTLDLLLRIIFCPNKLRFFFDMVNIVDTISLIAVYSHVIVKLCIPNEKYKESLVDIMEAIHLLRILRLLRILQKMRVFRVLAYSLKTGYQEFILVISFFSFAAVTFGCLICHLDGKNKILHIPDGIYWAVVTMTTVGYGDMYPMTFLGKVIAGCMAVLGSLISASLIPVFVNNFLFFYTNSNNLSLETKPKAKSKTRVGCTGKPKLQKPI